MPNSKIKTKKRRVLTELSSKQFFIQNNIPVTKTILTTTPEEAVNASRRLGFPIVMKVISPDIVHKTEANSVAVDVRTYQEVESTYSKLIKNAKIYNPNARIYGITVQQMAKGSEFFIGAARDPQFGPTVAFGLGGIYVEVLKDVTFRVVPIDKDDAEEMLTEIKAYPLIKGVRNQEPLNKEEIVNILLKISEIMDKNPKIKEIDINPLIVNTKKALAADARIVLEE